MSFSLASDWSGWSVLLAPPAKYADHAQVDVIGWFEIQRRFIELDTTVLMKVL